MRHSLQIFATRVSSFFSLIGGLGIVLMLFHVTIDVLSRQIFNYPPPATVLVVSHYYMVMIAFFPLGWAELRGDMISVEVLSWLFKGKALKFKTILIDLIIVAVYVFLAVTTWDIALSELKVKSYQVSLSVVVPLWPSYFILPIAFAVAALLASLRLYFYLTPQADDETGLEKGQKS